MANVVGPSTMTISMAVAAAAYGVVLSLSFNCLYLLWSSRATAMRWRLILFVSWIFLLATFIVAFQIRSTEAFLSSPSASELNKLNAVVAALFFLEHWTTEGLLLYRCHVIYTSKIKILVFPGVLYVACLGISIAFVVSAARSRTDDPRRILLIVYLCVSSILHVFLQLAVIGRILYFRRLSRQVNASKLIAPEQRDVYTSLTSMLIESATLDTGATILYLILVLLDKSSIQEFTWLLSSVWVIASLLIIMRVARGVGWSQNTSRRLTGPTAETSQGGLVFADGDAEDSTIANNIA